MAGYFADMKLTLVEAATAAGSSAITSATVDMAGYDSVLFFTTVGTITSGAVTSIYVQQSSDDGSSDAYAALAGTGITIADDDDGETFGVEIIRPRERYLQCVVSRATQNAVVGEIYALQYNGRSRPVTNTVTDVSTFESHESPSEGSA